VLFHYGVTGTRKITNYKDAMNRFNSKNAFRWKKGFILAAKDGPTKRCHEWTKQWIGWIVYCNIEQQGYGKLTFVFPLIQQKCVSLFPNTCLVVCGQWCFVVSRRNLSCKVLPLKIVLWKQLQINYILSLIIRENRGPYVHTGSLL